MCERSSVSWAKLGQAQCSSHQVRPAQLAGLLAHSAGSAGSQLKSAGWSVGSSDQCVRFGRLPGRLVGQGWLWAGPENTCKWSGKNRDGRIPLPMAKTALRGEVRGKVVSWELGTTL
ncbi:hypothetical protein F2Q69_00058347 [Brassica cretica]|uniref:Uncharacterized protein n=1 Tax=Brassica cretica TaxID=69181 RepID=A0A8S9RJD9_BRACR|nr:hypothetical protein F2Q69_00058347 [Brassica cretica]